VTEILSNPAGRAGGLLVHAGHKIVCVKHGDVKVAVECETCGEVLMDFDKSDEDTE
jgi:hypothetical protein